MEWIKTSWETLPSGAKQLPRFTLDFSNAVYSNTDVKLIAKRVIHEISEKFPPPYHLMVSGGIDSQTMLWFWKQSGIPFTATSIRYKNNNDDSVFNEYDLLQLKEFADMHDITVHYKDLDILHFLENELETYANNYQCTSPQICTHMKISEMCEDGTVLFSGNFKTQTALTYTILGLSRYQAVTNRNLIPFFLLHDAELAASTDRFEAEAKKLNYDTINAMLHGYYLRVAILHAAGIPVIPQEQKFTGFEKIKDYYDAKDKEHALVSTIDRLRFSKPGLSRRVFDLLFRYKLTDKIKYNEVLLFKNLRQKND
jgi:hypothetical protein